RHPWVTGLVTATILVSAAFPLGSLRQEMREHRARVLEAERSLIAIDQELDSLHAMHERIATDLGRRNQLRSARWEGPLDDTLREPYLALLAERRERSDDLTPTYWELSRRISKIEGVLGKERVVPVQFAMWTDVAGFAERTGDRRLWLAAQAMLGHDERAITAERYPVTLNGIPTDAELYLFTYREEYQVRADARFPRRLPVPADARGTPLAFPAGSTWKPGEACRVVAAGFVAEDGHVVRDGTVIVTSDDRLVALEHDTWVPLHASRRTVERHSIPTQYPLFRLDANRVRGTNLALPAGSYLLLVTSLEHDPQRFPFVVTEHGTNAVDIDLVPRGTTPAGFVRVPPGWFRSGGDRGRSFQALPPAPRSIEGFWIAHKEVTFREYLAALSWKEHQEPGSTAEHLPMDRRGEDRETFDVDPEAFTIWPPGYADSPVCSIRYEDALFYCAILSERSVREGQPWVYELPWQLSWEKTARGADGRIFPWGGEEDDLLDSWAGDAFDWQLIDGARSRTPAPWIPAPTEHALGDESPYGVLGMTGGVEEYVFREPGEPTSSPARKGGGIGNPDPTAHRMPRVVPHATQPSRGYGFRVVARRRDDPPQGLRGAVEK
ncbi:MAG: SUMF1/EgtB/PvdO family nonheme iron enzyme, partial [Planctomycetes bacterium]|nr:SUMF1/EgtB/PvdO family nonheme iron enzyme [Planctomycetota bacterium]